jgi:hypothetical protein
MVPSRVRSLALSTARLLGVPKEKLIVPGVAHMGRSDCLFDLEVVAASGGAAGRIVLLIASSVGVFRSVALRL